MMDFDTFRTGLRAEPERPLRAVDIDEVMVRGRRLRRRRQLLATGGAAVLAAAVVTASAAGVTWRDQPTAQSPGAAPAGPAPAQSRGATPAGPAPAQSASAPPQTPLGSVVRTGIHVTAGEVVLYGLSINEPILPGVHFGVMAGLRDRSGAVTGVVETNEVTGSDRSPGFHAVQAPTRINGVSMPEFGYYAGPAATITATLAGHQVKAHLATWSVDHTIVLFWFDPSTADASRLVARDAKGHPLPAGHTTIGHG
jgi:hypothetical protein